MHVCMTALAGPKQLARLSEVAALFSEARPALDMPAELLDEAEAVAVVTHISKAGLGFVSSTRQGNGLMLVRGLDRQWKNPLFVTLQNVPVEAYEGGQAMAVLVFRTERAALALLDGPVVLGHDLSIAPGLMADADKAPLRVSFDRSEVVSFVAVRSSWLAVDLQPATLNVDSPQNEALYGATSTARRILAGQVERVPSEVLSFRSRFEQAWR